MERFHWAVRLSPLLVSVVLAVLWLSGAPPPVPDLRLSAPVVARPGSSVGLRAWQLDEDDVGRVSVRAPTVRVELRDAQGQTLSSTTLERSRVEGTEGRLDIPEELDGKHQLVATAVIDGREVSVERALYVREGIDSKLDAGRTVTKFQVYELGPLRRDEPARAPPVLDPRVEEGACAPDLPCTLSVWVGPWEGSVRARPVVGAHFAREVASVESGFARLDLTVTGPEARVVVEAIDEGLSVTARREVRLPLVAGGMTARAEVRGSNVALEWHSLRSDAPVLVDAFDEHRWVDAFSLAPGDSLVRGLPTGVWRLQLRQDLFSGNTGAVAFAVVPSGAGAPSRAAEHVLASGAERGLDPLAMAVVEGSFDGDPDAAVRALLAVPSFDVVTLGNGVSSRIGVDEAAAKVQESRRLGAAALILLVGLFVTVVLFRLEVLAAEQGNRLLESLSSGEAVASPPRATGRGLWVLALLVFVVIAALALSKGWF